MSLEIYKISDKAFLPEMPISGSAGVDLKSAYEYEIAPGSRICAKTDLKITFPEGCYGRVASRSGLALKNCVDAVAGVVDPNYRGNVGVLLHNSGKESFKIRAGDRIAQLVCEKYVAIREIKETLVDFQSERGERGFGSTGV
jgi:dUTP pyrophosphatase